MASCEQKHSILECYTLVTHCWFCMCCFYDYYESVWRRVVVMYCIEREVIVPAELPSAYRVLLSISIVHRTIAMVEKKSYCWKSGPTSLSFAIIFSEKKTTIVNLYGTASRSVRKAGVIPLPHTTGCKAWHTVKKRSAKNIAVNHSDDSVAPVIWVYNVAASEPDRRWSQNQLFCASFVCLFSACQLIVLMESWAIRPIRG